MEGQTLSHDRVLEMLGGGMGVLYKALATNDRPVALNLCGGGLLA